MISWQATPTVLLSIFLTGSGLGQQKATTEDGRQVILKDDGTWEYTEVFTALEKGLIPPKLLKYTKAGYTKEALAAEVQGAVLLKCVVRKSGRADKCEVVKGLPHGLSERAMAELQDNWRFEPGSLHGQPVDFEVTIEMTFEMR